MVGAVFLPGARGPLHLARWTPEHAAAASVLIVPPFAEEMNKCRPMLARVGRALAARGLGALLPDLTGTGDSAGEFRDARLAAWLDDLQRVARRAALDGAPLTGVIGVRFGALLALELAGLLPGIRRVALWQPVASGTAQLTQFLRLRVASGVLASSPEAGPAAESVASLTAVLARGDVIEVGGYELGPGLAADLREPDIRRLAPATGIALRWFEVSAAPQATLSRVATDRVAGWCAGGLAADGVVVPGDSFWSTVELTSCEPLVTATAAFLAGDA